MDHVEIENEQLMDLYLMDRLDPARTEQFELHLLGCASCADELEHRRTYIGALRALDPGDFGVIERPAARNDAGRWRAFALAASALLALSSVLSVWSLGEVAGLRRQLASGSLADTPIVVMSLEQVRGAGIAAPNVLETGAGPRWFVFEIDGDWEPERAYAVRVRAAAGAEVANATILPDHRGLLVAAVSSTRLAAGDYTVEVTDAEGRGPRSEFALQVVEASDRAR